MKAELKNIPVDYEIVKKLQERGYEYSCNACEDSYVWHTFVRKNETTRTQREINFIKDPEKPDNGWAFLIGLFDMPGSSRCGDCGSATFLTEDEFLLFTKFMEGLKAGDLNESDS